MVFRDEVSVPLVGSVTPNACSRSSPVAMPRQQLLLLVLAAVPQHRAHGVHLGVAGAGVAAGAVHFLEDGGACADLQPRAAIFLRDQHAEIAGLGQRLHELGRVGHLAVELAPVFARKALAQLGDGVADVLMIVVHSFGLGTHGNVHVAFHPSFGKAIARPCGPGYGEKAGVKNRF